MTFDIAAVTPAPDDISQIHGMLWPREKQLLYYIGAKLYTGIGAIAELGCYVGLSTSCFARGLADNVVVKNKEKRIHSYDWFHFLDRPPYNDHMRAAGVSTDQLIINVFIANTRSWAQMITAHPGDLLEQNWSGSPIEILFVDIAKTWLLNEHIIKHFFPSLIPGHSYVVHQDYLFWHNPWIPVTMEYFSDYFSIVDCSGTTVTFKLVHPLPYDRLQHGILALPDAAKLALMDRAVARAKGEAKPMLLLAKARLLSELYGWPVANKLIDEVIRDHGESHLVPNYVEEMREYCAREMHEQENLGKAPFPEHLLPKQSSMGSILWTE